ncbi:MAG TPA: hypothetical protein VFX35_12500 [Solirubrobacterales bacterium]|nr:hypothetical protein [Solirubrobacterales bacterium]
MTTIAVKPPTERKRAPYRPERPCVRCKAHLLTTNPGPLCAPCELALPPEQVDHLKQHADALSEHEIAQLQRERLQEIGAVAA